VKLGVTIPNIELGTEPGPVVDLAQAAENIGYDYLMNYDHVLGADLSVRSTATRRSTRSMIRFTSRW